MQRELDVLKADYASQGAVLATLKEALARSEKQLSDTASSKAHEITELEV